MTVKEELRRVYKVLWVLSVLAGLILVTLVAAWWESHTDRQEQHRQAEAAARKDDTIQQEGRERMNMLKDMQQKDSITLKRYRER